MRAQWQEGRGSESSRAFTLTKTFDLSPKRCFSSSDSETWSDMADWLAGWTGKAHLIAAPRLKHRRPVLSSLPVETFYCVGDCPKNGQLESCFEAKAFCPHCFRNPRNPSQRSVQSTSGQRSCYLVCFAFQCLMFRPKTGASDRCLTAFGSHTSGCMLMASWGPRVDAR